MVPVQHPRFVMVVAVNEPVGTYYGGVVAAPVFRNVMDGALRLMDVPPDDIDTWLAEQARQRAALQASATPVIHRASGVPATPGPTRPVALDAAGADGAPLPIDMRGMRR